MKRGFRPKPPVKKKDLLFDGDSALFEEAAAGVKTYFEYGVGLSTVWIDQNTDASIVGVDTSVEWRDKVAAKVSNERHHLKFIDVGPLGGWGMPLGFSARQNFSVYVDGPWSEGTDADLVLIDGRFRISCFLNSLVRGAAGTKIIFDDYCDRPAYHVVEEFLEPETRTDRQALFVIPEKVDTQKISSARDAFLMVRE